MDIKKTFALAIKNHQKNDIQAAQDLYNQILKINPNHLGSLNNLGVAFDSLGDFNKSKDCYEKVITINPNSTQALNNLGNVFRMMNEHQKAINYYEKAIENDPNFIDAFNNLAVAFKDLDMNDKAKSCYEKTTEIDPHNPATHNKLGTVLQLLGEHQKAKECFEKAITIDPNSTAFIKNFSITLINISDDFDEIINLSCKTLKMQKDEFKFINQSISLFRLKHDVQQAKYLSSKNYAVDGVDQFQKVGDEILGRKENNEGKNNYDKKILLTPDEISALLPFYKSDFTYKPKKISGSCINPNKNWQDVEDEYFNSSNQIMYIDDFLSDEALIELREFCLISKVWNTEYPNKYLGAFGEQGFISPMHLQIAVELKQKLPKLFGPHDVGGFWGFKYDSTLGKGINIHVDFAKHNLNFWITPDEYNNNKNGGGLKVYDTPAPDHWTLKDYNDLLRVEKPDKIYKFLKENDAKCTNVPHKCNRAVLFNSAYFHETDEIDFKDEYEGRRINNTYLFGNRLVKEIK
jgi:tetratricopeptide (TPR) repeat protein